MLLTPVSKYGVQDGREVKQSRPERSGMTGAKNKKALTARMAELEARLEQMLTSCTEEQVNAVRSAIELLDEVKEQSQILDQWQVALFESLNECVVVVETDNLISYVNPVF
ncbi:MAG: hypothetical protein HGB11_00005, partial [Chlorobiales bacterium]|nr:hypothetical protein [Chlorobiales bacterium]